MVDKQALLDTLAAIELDPSRWRQESWAFRPDGAVGECGTTFCLAGHVVRVRYPDAQFLYTINSARNPGGTAAVNVVVNGELCDIENLAQDVLDLTDKQTALLFWYGIDNEDGEPWDVERDGEVTLEGLRERVKRVINDNEEK